MKITIQRDDAPLFEVKIPLATVLIADEYARLAHLSGIEHLLLKMLYDKLLLEVILPRAKYDPEVMDKIKAMEAELADKKKALEAARIGPLLPTLLVDGQGRTLTQLQAQNVDKEGTPTS